VTTHTREDTAKDKKVTDEAFQESDVWFKVAGGWKVAHVHYSPAAAATVK
jgi:hypothetical protein